MPLLNSLLARLEATWPVASLRTYLIAVMLLATLPLAFLMSLHAFVDVRRDQMRIDDSLARSAAALADAVDREMTYSFEALAVLARSAALQRGPSTHVDLKQLLLDRQRREWDSVFLLDRDANVLLDSARQAGAAGPLSEPLRELHRQVTARAAPAVSGLLEAPGPGPRTVVLAVPVMRGEAVQYVLGARVNEDVWQSLAKTAGTPAGASVSLLDAQWHLIGGAARAASAPRMALDKPGGVQRLAGADGSAVYGAWRAARLSGWRVHVDLPAGPIDAAHRKVIVTALSISGGGVLLGLLLASMAARRITRPLRHLATRGPVGLAESLAVEEIVLLRDALLRAAVQDAAAHDSLRGKAQEFQTLFNSSPIGMAFAQDSACHEIWHNAAMDTLIGPRGSHRAGTVRVLHQGRVLPPGRQPLQRAAALGETVAGMELEIAIDGRPSAFVIANAVPLCDANGRSRGAISALVDITHRKRIEQRLLAADQQLRENQRLMELAQEAGHVGFFHYWFGADRLAWTPGQCKLFGLEALPAGGLRQWFDRIAERDRDRVERDFWTACALRREKETLEYCVSHLDGRSRWLSSRILLQYDGAGRASQMTGVTVDMTDQRQAELERAQLTERALSARQEAEAASRAKDEFLTMLSHELRNPLGAISAASDVLDAAEAGSANAVEAQAIIARQTRNLTHMMNDLLDVGRVIAGKIMLSRQPVNLAAIVQRVNDMFTLTGESRDHPVKIELAEAWIDGDAVRIEQVVTNLLTNALRYTPSGRAITLKVGVQEGTAVLQVEDAGMGIPAALLPHIFDLFVQGERPLHRRAGGLGIGLTLVRRLVELHGGTVGVESSAEGTRFTVRLPSVGVPPQEQDFPLPPSRRRNVLVVEDNDDVLAALRSKLELEGHRVTTAGDGLEGLTSLLRLRPEVSIVDIGLPGLTGLELARHARAAGYAGRMIALSGYGAERDARAALVAGFDAYLVKPVDRDQLRATLSAD